MRIRIQSDFRDYYDHAFCGSWETPDAIFERKIKSGLSRSAMFAAFELAGLLTPRYGLVRDLVPALKAEYANFPKELREMQVVVHLDEQAHAGEGKVALSFDAAETQYPAAFAVEFLPTFAGVVGAVSYRHLRIGKRAFWLRYTSRDDWRSNCGDVQIEVMREAESSAIADAFFLNLSPMVAVDFLTIGNKMYAIDLNTAPGLRGTGIETIMSTSDVLQEVEAWFVRTGRKNIDTEKTL